jgi:transposase
MMTVVDGKRLPIALHVASAQPHELTLAEPTLRTIRVPQKRGRPKTKPKESVANKAYDSTEFRQQLRRRGIKPTILTFEWRKRERPKRGWPIRVGTSYRQRWKVESCFGWMDNCRLVVRYDRHLHIYRTFCLVASILFCLQQILN